MKFVQKDLSLEKKGHDEVRSVSLVGIVARGRMETYDIALTLHPH